MLRGLINIWVIAGAVLVAIILFVVTTSLLWFTRGNVTQLTPATAVLNVIYMPTSAPTAVTPTPSAEVTPTDAVPPSPIPGVIAIGAYVEITGTGGDGLRLRAEPGLRGEVLFLGYESEVFQVHDGPRENDGYTWWLVVAPYDETVSGWAVANYLSLVQNP